MKIYLHCNLLKAQLVLKLLILISNDNYIIQTLFYWIIKLCIIMKEIFILLRPIIFKNSRQMSYSKIISLSVALEAKLSIVDFAISNILNGVHSHMLYHVSFLSKWFPAYISEVWLVSLMHHCVVSKVPALGKCLSTARILANDNLSLVLYRINLFVFELITL